MPFRLFGATPRVTGAVLDVEIYFTYLSALQTITTPSLLQFYFE